MREKLKNKFQKTIDNKPKYQNIYEEFTQCYLNASYDALSNQALFESISKLFSSYISLGMNSPGFDIKLLINLAILRDKVAAMILQNPLLPQDRIKSYQEVRQHCLQFAIIQLKLRINNIDLLNDLPFQKECKYAIYELVDIYKKLQSSEKSTAINTKYIDLANLVVSIAAHFQPALRIKLLMDFYNVNYQKKLKNAYQPKQMQDDLLQSYENLTQAFTKIYLYKKKELTIDKKVEQAEANLYRYKLTLQLQKKSTTEEIINNVRLYLFENCNIFKLINCLEIQNLTQHKTMQFAISGTLEQLKTLKNTVPSFIKELDIGIESIKKHPFILQDKQRNARGKALELIITPQLKSLEKDYYRYQNEFLKIFDINFHNINLKNTHKKLQSLAINIDALLMATSTLQRLYAHIHTVEAFRLFDFRLRVFLAREGIYSYCVQYMMNMRNNESENIVGPLMYQPFVETTDISSLANLNFTSDLDFQEQIHNFFIMQKQVDEYQQLYDNTQPLLFGKKFANSDNKLCIYNAYYYRLNWEEDKKSNPEHAAWMANDFKVTYMSIKNRYKNCDKKSLNIVEQLNYIAAFHEGIGRLIELFPEDLETNIQLNMDYALDIIELYQAIVFKDLRQYPAYLAQFNFLLITNLEELPNSFALLNKHQKINFLSDESDFLVHFSNELVSVYKNYIKYVGKEVPELTAAFNTFTQARNTHLEIIKPFKIAPLPVTKVTKKQPLVSTESFPVVKKLKKIDITLENDNLEHQEILEELQYLTRSKEPELDRLLSVIKRAENTNQPLFSLDIRASVLKIWCQYLEKDLSHILTVGNQNHNNLSFFKKFSNYLLPKRQLFSKYMDKFKCEIERFETDLKSNMPNLPVNLQAYFKKHDFELMQSSLNIKYYSESIYDNIRAKSEAEKESWIRRRIEAGYQEAGRKITETEALNIGNAIYKQKGIINQEKFGKISPNAERSRLLTTMENETQELVKQTHNLATVGQHLTHQLPVPQELAERFNHLAEQGISDVMFTGSRLIFALLGIKSSSDFDFVTTEDIETLIKTGMQPSRYVKGLFHPQGSLSLDLFVRDALNYRPDVTVSAFLMNKQGVIYDITGHGFSDFKAKKISCFGEDLVSIMSEDMHKALRVIKYQCLLQPYGFTIAPQTAAALHNLNLVESSNDAKCLHNIRKELQRFGDDYLELLNHFGFLSKLFSIEENNLQKTKNALLDTLGIAKSSEKGLFSLSKGKEAFLDTAHILNNR